jgi:hypothetical protein
VGAGGRDHVPPLAASGRRREACECYFQAFQFVVWSGLSARDALSNVLFETQGTA